jgi:hypothetical protein
MRHCLGEAAMQTATAQISFSESTKNCNNNEDWANILKSFRDSFDAYNERSCVTDFLFGRCVLSTVVFLGPAKDGGTSPRDVHVYVVTNCCCSDDNPVNFQLYRLERNLDKIVTKLNMRYYEWEVAPFPTQFGDLQKTLPSPNFEASFGCLLPLMGNPACAMHMLVCRDREIYV